MEPHSISDGAEIQREKSPGLHERQCFELCNYEKAEKETIPYILQLSTEQHRIGAVKSVYERVKKLRSPQNKKP